MFLSGTMKQDILSSFSTVALNKHSSPVAPFGGLVSYQQIHTCTEVGVFKGDVYLYLHCFPL